MTAALVLVRHWMLRWDLRRDDDVHRQEPATGHPPVSTSPRVLERLRARCLSTWATPGEPVTWRPHDPAAWAAVLDLHQHGHHDDAVELARLLAWCDSWPHGPGVGSADMWRLVPAGQLSGTKAASEAATGRVSAESCELEGALW